MLNSGSSPTATFAGNRDDDHRYAPTTTIVVTTVPRRSANASPWRRTREAREVEMRLGTEGHGCWEKPSPVNRRIEPRCYYPVRRRSFQLLFTAGERGRERSLTERSSHRHCLLRGKKLDAPDPPAAVDTRSPFGVRHRCRNAGDRECQAATRPRITARSATLQPVEKGAVGRSNDRRASPASCEAESGTAAATPTPARRALARNPSSPSVDLRSWFTKKQRLRVTSSSGDLPPVFPKTHGGVGLRRHPLHSFLPAWVMSNRRQRRNALRVKARLGWEWLGKGHGWGFATVAAGVAHRRQNGAVGNSSPTGTSSPSLCFRRWYPRSG
nr:hypothetical protein Itr_chr13CG12850 [Ipomoea trifida]